MNKPTHGGGWQAIRYSLRKAGEVGPLRFWRAMRSKNACKTCAFGMGGQKGGMTNEAGSFPEVCKKSMQAMVADMQGRVEPRFFETYSVEQMQALSPRELEAMGRLVDPVVLEPGQDHFRATTWDEALSIVASGLEESAPERSFFYASGRSSNEAGFLMQLFARCFGTNHVSNCSYYCHQASGVGLSESLGTGTSTVALEDLEKCDLVFLIGGNPASNHPRLLTMLMKLRKRGGKVIVVNPLKEVGLQNFHVPSNVGSMLFGSEIASLYLQPTIGGDIALMAGIAKSLLERKLTDQSYIESNTKGFADLMDYVETLAWEEIETGSGVAREQIVEAANLYAHSNRAIFCWTMGITQHEHGVQNVQWIVNLALLRGMVGKKGAGVMPIRGHSNVQGMGSIGVSPALKEAVLKKLEEEGLKPPPFKGHDTISALEASHGDEMDFALCLGGNLFGASPDANFARESLSKLKTLVYLSTTLNTGHAHGLGQTTVILPVLARDEEPQSTTQESMFNFVRLSDGGPRRHDGPWSEVDVIAETAYRVLGEAGTLDWRKLKDHDEIRALIARTVPGWEAVGTMAQTKKEFQLPGRILHEPAFRTPDGKAKFQAHPLPALPTLGPNQLRLMTVRSEGQFNTVVYEEQDIYRGQDRRDVILMNPSDILRLGFGEDDFVDVTSVTGTIRNVLIRPFDIAVGCAAMYFPEANVLIPRTADPRSKTPAFKSVVVTIERPGALLPQPVARAAEVRVAARRNLNAC